jgi:NADPH-dependent curcumin reductase
LRRLRNIWPKVFLIAKTGGNVCDEEKTMSEVIAHKIVLAARPKGRIVAGDFRLEQAAAPVPGPGQLLLKTRYLSIDPYMRGRLDDRKSYAPPTPIDDVIVGESVAEVLVANLPGYSPGDLVLARTGWQTHSLSDGKGLRKLNPAAAPVTTGLGVLGMPGFTAYAGLRVIGQPKPGETVVVAAASGPVGSLVGQLARKAGARTVGIAGGQVKCAYLLEELGFDAAIDHRAPNFEELLTMSCPNGIDVYFENVGGAIWQAVLPLLNQFARVPVCGMIAHYNVAPTDAGQDQSPGIMRQILTKSLTLRGFINYDFIDLFPDFLREVGHSVQTGEIRYREDIVDGLENAPQALMGMLDGHNFGKLIVRVS